MKKLLLTMALAGVAAYASFAQGTVAIYTIANGFANYTNGAAYNSSLNGVYNTTGGKTTATANSFYYELLIQPYNAGASASALDASWTAVGSATNYLAGGTKGAGAGSGAPIPGWGAPTGNTYDTAEENSFILVGWSASLGSSWAQVEAQLQSGNWVANGFFGVSSVGYGYAGAGPGSLTAPNIFGASQGMPGGLANGITLYSVSPTSTPEPGTIALAGLGIAGLLALRRKK